MFVVLNDGQVYGPFETEDEAEAYAEEAGDDAEAQEVQSPS